MPNFDKFDMLKERKRLPGTAAGETSEVESGVTGEGEAPVDKADRLPTVEDVVRTQITVDEGKGSFSESA
jgi:hypothetical protein